jgi:hypothetical protein
MMLKRSPAWKSAYNVIKAYSFPQRRKARKVFITVRILRPVSLPGLMLYSILANASPNYSDSTACGLDVTKWNPGEPVNTDTVNPDYVSLHPGYNY